MPHAAWVSLAACLLASCSSDGGSSAEDLSTGGSVTGVGGAGLASGGAQSGGAATGGMGTGGATSGGAATGGAAVGGSMSAGGAPAGGSPATTGGTVNASGGSSDAAGGSSDAAGGRLDAAGGRLNAAGGTSGAAGGASDPSGGRFGGDTGGRFGGIGGGASGGSSAGGAGPEGGAPSEGGSTSEGGTTSDGGTGNGECQIGTTRGNEVVIIGESFIAMSSIPEHLAELAKAQGSLQGNESYIDNSVSGTTLGNDQIPSQYRQAQASNDIRFVVMDGGGNDCLQSNNPGGALAAAEALFQTMAEDGVEKVQYFFYPDPLGGFASGSLKSCLDTLRPQMQALCEGLTAPQCYFLDLRDTWNGHSEYTSDGIHPTEAGSVASADAIWEAMVENCVAQ